MNVWWINESFNSRSGRGLEWTAAGGLLDPRESTNGSSFSLPLFVHPSTRHFHPRHLFVSACVSLTLSQSAKSTPLSPSRVSCFIPSLSLSLSLPFVTLLLLSSLLFSSLSSKAYMCTFVLCLCFFKLNDTLLENLLCLWRLYDDSYDAFSSTDCERGCTSNGRLRFFSLTSPPSTNHLHCVSVFVCVCECECEWLTICVSCSSLLCYLLFAFDSISLSLSLSLCLLARLQM